MVRDSRASLAVSSLTRAARRWMAASHSTAIPSRIGFSHGDSSVMRFQHRGLPCFGRRLHSFAATNPLYPNGPFQGEPIFNPAPLHPAPPGLPTTPSGSVDILAIITPHVHTRQRTLAGQLADRISRWAVGAVKNDGVQYEEQSADGIVRAYPMPPGQLPLWHGQANLQQPVNAVPVGQVSSPNVATPKPCLPYH